MPEQQATHNAAADGNTCAADTDPALDLPCPQCGYNLRGLPASLCPECGTAFDPDHLRRVYRDGREPPDLRWILVNMVRHPIRFWQLPQVQYTVGLGPRQTFAILAAALYASLAVGVVVAMLGARSWWRGSSQDVMQILAWFPLSFAGMWLLLAMHGTVARIFVPQEVGGRSPLKRNTHILSPDPIVGYAAVWLIPVLTCLVPLGQADGPEIWVLLLTVVLLASCIAWAVTLYHGGRAVTGRPGPAIWYAASNPLWLVLLLGLG